MYVVKFGMYWCMYVCVCMYECRLLTRIKRRCYTVNVPWSFLFFENSYKGIGPSSLPVGKVVPICHNGPSRNSTCDRGGVTGVDNTRRRACDSAAFLPQN